MVRVERSGPVVVITLDRPERRNAVDHPTLLELLKIQAEIAVAVPLEIRVVVLTGAAPAFSAGADLTGVEEGRFATDLARVLRNFTKLSVPVVVAVDGPALGAGTQLAVACDLRVATAASVFGIPAAKLGLAVDHWTIRRVAAEFSPPVARGMLVGAETYTAEELHRLGGVHRLGDLTAALDWAQRLAKLAPLTTRAHKVGLETAVAEPPAVDAFENLRRLAWASNDAEEGRTAFLDKRRPNFTGE